jgi:hypothetical protein
MLTLIFSDFTDDRRKKMLTLLIEQFTLTISELYRIIRSFQEKVNKLTHFCQNIYLLPIIRMYNYNTLYKALYGGIRGVPVFLMRGYIYIIFIINNLTIYIYIDGSRG